MPNEEAQSGDQKPIESVRVLLDRLIDYAGLFPPSQLTMPEAVLNYATYRASNYGWILGPFILPVARLDEFMESAAEFLVGGTGTPWQLSVLAGEDINDTAKRIAVFNKEHAGHAEITQLEVKANTVSKIENTLSILPEGVRAYFEIATGENFVDLLMALSVRKLRAKLRTGGVANDDFPSSREVIRFVRSSMAANVPFKATAGLHHPLRCFRPLTYAPDAPRGTMHGFLNMLLMTGFARESFRPTMLEELMEEEFEEVFGFTHAGVAWRNEHFLTNAHLRLLRERGMNSFGSCSFEEPVADLRELGLL